MSQIIPGKNILVFIDDVAIAANKECTLKISADIQAIAGTTPDWEDNIVKRKKWEVSTKSLLTYDKSLKAADLVGKKVKIAFALSESHPGATDASQRTLDGFVYSGMAICSEGSMTGAVKSLASDTYKFVGCGPLTTTDEYTYLIEDNDDYFVVSKY